MQPCSTLMSHQLHNISVSNSQRVGCLLMCTNYFTRTDDLIVVFRNLAGAVTGTHAVSYNLILMLYYNEMSGS